MHYSEITPPAQRLAVASVCHDEASERLVTLDRLQFINTQAHQYDESHPKRTDGRAMRHASSETTLAARAAIQHRMCKIQSILCSVLVGRRPPALFHPGVLCCLTALLSDRRGSRRPHVRCRCRSIRHAMRFSHGRLLNPVLQAKVRAIFQRNDII